MESLVAENKFEKFLCNKAVMEKIPLSGTFELTPLCNMNCEMCYIRLNKEEMNKQGRIKSAKEWLEIANEASQSGMLFVLLTGGEPLLHPEFKKIYLGLKKLGMYITINTNGTLIDENMADFFAEHTPRRINITLYGVNNETYDNLCHNPTGFDQTIKAIELLKKRNVPVKLNATFTQKNIKDFQAILDIADYYQLPVEIPFYVYPQNRKIKHKEPDDFRLNPAQAAKLRFDYFSYSSRYDKNKMYLDVKNALANIDQHNKEFLPPKPKGFWCHSGFSAFWMNWKGQITSCGMINQPFVVYEENFKITWKKLLDITGRIELSHKCYYCQYFSMCGVCAASMQSETGKFDKTPDYRCQLMHEYEKILRNFVKEYENENK